MLLAIDTVRSHLWRLKTILLDSSWGRLLSLLSCTNSRTNFVLGSISLDCNILGGGPLSFVVELLSIHTIGPHFLALSYRRLLENNSFRLLCLFSGWILLLLDELLAINTTRPHFLLLFARSLFDDNCFSLLNRGLSLLLLGELLTNITSWSHLLLSLSRTLFEGYGFLRGASLRRLNIDNLILMLLDFHLRLLLRWKDRSNRGRLDLFSRAWTFSVYWLLSSWGWLSGSSRCQER